VPLHPPRLTAIRRDEERVTALELFFDLVFVLAITQCTALMAADPTWAGLFRGLVVLGVLWWSWVGYSWLTSVVDPEEGGVRIVMFAAMAGLLVVALCVPEAFGDLGLTFAVAYGVVRMAHIALFLLTSREEFELRRSVIGLGIGTTTGVGLLVVASFTDGWVQGALWALALLLDVGEPFIFGAEGWQLVPQHFAERHGLIIIIALGESIVAIGVGSEAGVDGGVIVAAVLGIALVAAMWWAYFDVDSIVASRRLVDATPGREQNEMARDAYSYLHFPMSAGIVLVALGLKTTIAHLGEALPTVPAVAFVGGTSLYLLAHVAFRLRTVGTVSGHRLAVAVAMLVLIPVARELAALVTVGLVAAVLCALILYETIRFADERALIRRQLLHGQAGE
jgi:low temperature requirement protein LtrA